MTRDEIIKRMGWLPSAEHGMSDVVDRIERIVRAAEQREREACAKACEQSNEDGEGPDCWGWHSKDYAAAIRARGQEPPR